MIHILLEPIDKVIIFLQETVLLMGFYLLPNNVSKV
jgi:hypothetical protein